ncbi:MAG: pyridoxamine 5'-phosphate oxidase family protein [Chloroflexia bacterium]
MPTNHDPITEVDPRFSDNNAPATPWPEASGLLKSAKIYWLTTVRPDTRPHVTPLYAIWLDNAFYFCTGATERKAKNIAQNPHCIVTTGCNTVEGVDVILEGDALPITDDATLQTLAAKYLSKYNWPYEAHDGALYTEGNRAEVYKIAPTKAFGFAKGGTFSQTRYTF